MCDKNYAHHITQKYCLAIALAVLREKPEDISIEDYLQQLRNKLNNEQTDMDATVCSNDFDIDDTNIVDDDATIDLHTTQESVTLLKDYVIYEDTDVNIGLGCDKSYNVNDLNNRSATATLDSINLLNDNTVFTDVINKDDRRTNDETAMDTQESVTLLKDYDENFNNIHNSTTVYNNRDGTEVHCNMGINENRSPFTTEKNQNNYLLKDTRVNEPIHVNYSQLTEMDALQGTQNICTHISQSQFDNIVIKGNLIRPKSNATAVSTVNCNVHNNDTVSCDNAMKTKINVPKHNENTAYHNIMSVKNYTELKTKNVDVDAKESNDLTNVDSVNSKMDIDENAVESENVTFSQHAQDLNDLLATPQTDSRNITNRNDVITNGAVDTDIIIGRNDVVTNGTVDTGIGTIPFKVMEEMNKVKCYLNRRQERSSNDGSLDSGYKTDSQRSFNSSSQVGSWLNQSAHSLFDYIMQCQLVATKQQIAEEISKILAQLVDRLHEEEKFLSFLDEMLESVDTLLSEVAFGENDDENVLLTKDQDIHRLFLLNKSSHLQRYTIGKITNMLENLHGHISNTDSPYEVTNISHIENACYIFHILEVLLRNYEKGEDTTTKQLTKSQGDLKMSSITSIWRKKWYPHLRENAGSQEMVRKECVLAKCNEVLNKIVVNCMDGYSLLSYSALQCFNLLQS